MAVNTFCQDQLQCPVCLVGAGALDQHVQVCKMSHPTRSRDQLWAMCAQRRSDKRALLNAPWEINCIPVMCFTKIYLLLYYCRSLVAPLVIIYSIYTATCDDLTMPTNGAITYSPTSFPRPQGTIAMYRCNSGYTGGTVRTCQSDRTWSGVSITCQRKVLDK